MKTNCFLLAAMLLILGVGGAAQFVSFSCGCAYRHDAVLGGYHGYVSLWLSRYGVTVERGVTSNGWVYNYFKQRNWVRVSRAVTYPGRMPLGPYIDFEWDLTFRWVFVPYWLLALLPGVLLAWRQWMRWRRARKAKGRGFEVAAARG